jgi:trans-aconitate 2-methyltransferase
VILGGHVARLAEADRDPFVHQVASRLAEPVVDYVRLNIVATRA